MAEMSWAAGVLFMQDLFGVSPAAIRCAVLAIRALHSRSLIQFILIKQRENSIVNTNKQNQMTLP
jgi:hypothetical protein